MIAPGVITSYSIHYTKLYDTAASSHRQGDGLEAGASPPQRPARAKGLPETCVFFRHILKNAMIPILTGVVVVIPLLFMGSLLTESFFGICLGMQALFEGSEEAPEERGLGILPGRA